MSVAAPERARRSAAVAAATPRTARGLRALVARGLRDNRRAPLVWGAPLGAMSALVVAIYPSISASLDKAMEGYPEGLKQAFGISDLGSVEAYLHAEMFSFVIPLAVAYFAMRFVAQQIVGAEERGHLDTLLAAPVSRRTLVGAALATVAVAVASVLAATGALALIAALLVGEALAVDRLLAALAGVWALAMFFAGCATLAAGLLHRSAPVLGIGAGVLVAMYLVDVLGKISGDMAQLRWLSAFRYVGAPLQEGLNLGGFLLLVGAGALLAAAGAVCFERRDVSS